MSDLRYTLLADGPSDRALMPILSWLLREHLPHRAIQAEWADLGRFPRPPKRLSDKIVFASEQFPCDLLFVHRDAEREPHEIRIREIRQAVAEINTPVPPVVCVVPVRMQEAWLLIDELALRQAANNPNGGRALHIPRLADIERLPDPKDTLHSLLGEASGLGSSRKRRISPGSQSHRLANLIDDFSSLRALSAFQALEIEVERVITEQRWGQVDNKTEQDFV